MYCLMSLWLLTVVSTGRGVISDELTSLSSPWFEGFACLDTMCDDVQQIRHNISDLAADVKVIKEALIGSTLYPSCRAILEDNASLGTGWYWIKPENTARPLNVYCDQESGRGGWMRLYYKEGANTCFKDPKIIWNPSLVESLGISGQGIDFAVSEDPLRVATGLSWVLRDVTWTADYLSTKLSNLLSCRTPTGTEWSLAYQESYVYVRGTFETFGGFSTMYVGCGWTSTASIGQSLTLRIGGRIRHTGEFIHTACNGYGINRDNSITSRWNSANTRVMWVRV